MKTKNFKLIVITCAFVPCAYAYVDPGSGMLLWQGVVALVGAVLIFFKNPIQMVKLWLKRFFGK